MLGGWIERSCGRPGHLREIRDVPSLSPDKFGIFLTTKFMSRHQVLSRHIWSRAVLCALINRDRRSLDACPDCCAQVMVHILDAEPINHRK